MELRDAPRDRSPRNLIRFGVVNIDKPSGPTSHEVSHWVKQLLGTERTAHVGTLDPKVTGCLPVLTGDATRLVQALLEKKEYVAVLELHSNPPADLEQRISEFETEIHQKPPKKSAVRRELRTRTIYSIDVLEVIDRQVLLSIACESGTYIRKLCHDIGLTLGTGAHMGDLRRTATTPFTDAGLVTLQDLTDAMIAWEDDQDPTPLKDILHPGERALSHVPKVVIKPSAATQVIHGAPVYAPGIISVPDIPPDTLVACYTPNNSVVCLGRLLHDSPETNGKIIDLERVLV